MVREPEEYKLAFLFIIAESGRQKSSSDVTPKLL